MVLEMKKCNKEKTPNNKKTTAQFVLFLRSLLSHNQ